MSYTVNKVRTITMKIKLDPLKGANTGANVNKLHTTTTTHGTNIASGAGQSLFNQSAATNAAANVMSSSSGANDRTYPPALV